jgi:hypothetical protein
VREVHGPAHGYYELAVAPPVVLLSYFELDDLRRLLDAVEPAGIPSSVPVYVGSYGVSREASGLIRSLAQGRYAPMFPVQPGTFWEVRRAPDVPDDAYMGRIPSYAALMRLSAERRVAWGRELGRRYRDSIRAARREGVRVDTWQFDELLGQAARSGGRGYREFLRGVLAGLTFGRPQLNEPEERGFVWSPLRVLELASLPTDSELATFWLQLDRSCFRIAGEEYPRFEGDPRAAASAQARAQRVLGRRGTARRSLAAKYLAGMTPGQHLGPGLGGNVHKWSRSRVARWREAYADERTRSGVAGLGQFHFRLENASTPVMRDALRAIGRALS